MSASEMVRQALTSKGKTQTELAEHMGWSKQNLSSRLKNDSLTFDELAKALAFCGYSVVMVDANGEDIPNLGNSESPRVVQMCDGHVYDTSKAESVCTSKPDFSEDWYMELFRDPAGTYFMVQYQLWEGGKSILGPVSNRAANMFMKKYRKFKI